MVSSNKRVRKSESAALRRLKRESTKLRRLLDDVWEGLTGADNLSSVHELREVIDSACDQMVASLPEEYFYSVDDDEQEMALDQSGWEESALNQTGWDSEVMQTVHMVENEPDVNKRLPLLREAIAKKAGIPFSPLSEDEYRHLVTVNFGAAVLTSAQLPCSLRAEAARYIQTLRALQSSYPQRRRTTDDRIRMAMEMRKRDVPWHDIYPKVLERPISSEAKSKLRHNVAAHLHNERNRPAKGHAHKSPQPDHTIKKN